MFCRSSCKPSPCDCWTGCLAAASAWRCEARRGRSRCPPAGSHASAWPMNPCHGWTAFIAYHRICRGPCTLSGLNRALCRGTPTFCTCTVLLGGTQHASSRAILTLAGAGVAVGGVRARPNADLCAVLGVAADLGSAKRLRPSDRTPRSAASAPAAPAACRAALAAGSRWGCCRAMPCATSKPRPQRAAAAERHC